MLTAKKFSLKLNRLFIDTLKSLSFNPYIGKKTEIENIRVKIVRDYLVFYKILNDKEILVLTIWDARRNPQTFNLTESH